MANHVIPAGTWVTIDYTNKDNHILGIIYYATCELLFSHLNGLSSMYENEHRFLYENFEYRISFVDKVTCTNLKLEYKLQEDKALFDDAVGRV